MNGLKSFKLMLVSTLLFSACGKWSKIIDKNKNALITVRYYAPYKLNNESIGTFFATGIIVDKKKGLVLVDRETAQVSPSTIVGYLQNYEEIDLEKVYHDPIHNYAFMKFDPKKIKFERIGEIDLGDSKTIKMGDEILLLATKKNKNLGAVQGNIVDIRKPKRRYKYKYQDYNIDYYDASLVSVNEGGGVILDKKGKGIALHGWIHEMDPYDEGKDKSFFAELPINAVKDVLKSLKREAPIKRRDLGLVLEFLTYSEAANLGVAEDIIARIKKESGSKGLLLVSSVVKGTPNDTLFRTGDILLSINGHLIGDEYLKYEKILNENKDKEISVVVIRLGKEKLIKGRVFDLLRKQPDKFVLFSGGVFQNIPWFIKVRTNIGNEGIYVSNYYLGSPIACANFFENNVITHINGIPIKNIDEFYKFIKNIRNDELLRVRYIDLVLNNKESIRSFRVNTKFFPTRLFHKTTHETWQEP